jgi:predicted CXXCH cytochrome family protein
VAARRRPAGLVAALLGPLAILSAILLVAGCVPATRYRTLAFFFDGVPDPNAPPVPDRAALVAAPAVAGPAGVETPAERPGPRLYHKPYTEFQCGKCHGRDLGSASQSLLKPVEDGLCSECHPDIGKNVRYAHAPVLVNACLQCHEPHVSNGPHLLSKSALNVCARCHYASDLSAGAHHRDATSPSDSTCLSCHLAHGGPRRHLLRTAGGPE